MSTDIHCDTILASTAIYERTRETALGAWAPYPARWTATGAAPDLKDGTLIAHHAQAGTTCFVRIALTIGTATVLGQGTYRLTLPHAAAPFRTTFSAYILRQKQDRFYLGAAVLVTLPGDQLQLVVAAPSGGSGALWTATYPAVLESTDLVVVSGAYEMVP